MNISLDIHRAAQLRIAADCLLKMADEQEANQKRVDDEIDEAPIPPIVAADPTPVVSAQMAAYIKPDVADGGTPDVADGGTPDVIVPTADVKLDKDGLPWDERIHSGKPTINANGSWKRRKGVEDSVFNTVRAQLMDQERTTAPTPPTLPDAPTAPTPPTLPDAPTAPTPPTLPGNTNLTFPEVMVAYQGCLNVGYTVEQLNQVATEFGVPVFALIASQSPKWVAVKARLESLIEQAGSTT